MEEQFIIDLTVGEKIKFAIARVKDAFCKKTVNLDGFTFDEEEIAHLQSLIAGDEDIVI